MFPLFLWYLSRTPRVTCLATYRHRAFSPCGASSTAFIMHPCWIASKTNLEAYSATRWEGRWAPPFASSKTSVKNTKSMCKVAKPRQTCSHGWQRMPLQTNQSNPFPLHHLSPPVLPPPQMKLQTTWWSWRIRSVRSTKQVDAPSEFMNQVRLEEVEIEIDLRHVRENCKISGNFKCSTVMALESMKEEKLQKKCGRLQKTKQNKQASNKTTAISISGLHCWWRSYIAVEAQDI